jgi:hypothetical protein
MEDSRELSDLNHSRPSSIGDIAVDITDHNENAEHDDGEQDSSRWRRPSTGYSRIPFLDQSYPRNEMARRESANTLSPGTPGLSRHASSLYTLESATSDVQLVKAPVSGRENSPISAPSRRFPLPPRWWPALGGMYALFFMGVLGAVAHHIFYQTLNGREATNQIQMLRYGTVLAFFTKVCLVASVVVAYRQRLWYTVRSKALAVATIDAMFAATDDVTSLLEWEIFSKARLAAALLVAVW